MMRERDAVTALELHIDSLDAEESVRARLREAVQVLAPRRKRSAKKLAPGKSREERRTERMERVSAIRSEVFLRAAGKCEFCTARRVTYGGFPVNPATEWHHCIGGGLRRYREGVETTAAICVPCHRGWDNADPGVLDSAKVWALRNGFRVALREIEHRISKLAEARASQGGTRP